MARYGSDKPDLRFGMELVDVSDVAAGCGFGVFKGAVEAGGQVKGINAKGCGGYSRKQIDELTGFVKAYKAKGLAYIALGRGRRGALLLHQVPHRGGDAGDHPPAGGRARRPAALRRRPARRGRPPPLGALRIEMGSRWACASPDEFNLLWVVDFPLLEWDEEENRFVAVHHPFTSPHPEDLDKVFKDGATREELAAIRANAYDLVLNGVELGGGSIRIHQRTLQNRMFELLGFTPEEAQAKFGFLLDAFEYGAPPHGGIAFGLDRFVMLLAGGNIRDVIAFPKTAKARDLMTDAPSDVSEKQLRELHIRTTV